MCYELNRAVNFRNSVALNVQNSVHIALCEVSNGRTMRFLQSVSVSPARAHDDHSSRLEHSTVCGLYVFVACSTSIDLTHFYSKLELCFECAI